MDETSKEQSCGLDKKSCTPCHAKGDGSTHALSVERVEELLKELCPSWRFVAEEKQLEREFIAKNFKCGIDWINKVAEIAEQEGHHPDLHLTDYRTLKIVIKTHSINDVTENDFILAAKVDTIPVDYSPKWLKKNSNVTAGRTPEKLEQASQ